MKELHEQIKAIRKAKGLTQDEIAEVLGTKKSNISRMESGAISLSSEKLMILAKKFEMTIEEITSFESVEEIVKKEKERQKSRELELLEQKDKQIERMQQAAQTFVAFAVNYYQEIIEGKRENDFFQKEMPKTAFEAMSQIPGINFLINSENIKPDFPIYEPLQSYLENQFKMGVEELVKKIGHAFKNAPKMSDEELRELNL